MNIIFATVDPTDSNAILPRHSSSPTLATKEKEMIALTCCLTPILPSLAIPRKLCYTCWPADAEVQSLALKSEEGRADDAANHTRLWLLLRRLVNREPPHMSVPTRLGRNHDMSYSVNSLCSFTYDENSGSSPEMVA